ncbi:related to calpain-like protease PalBory [Ustilago trichophora]|uniref:Related to calpain-like protease PalBory n=1 Tax=Ustilago trichophora TaxID=86804 RepID=A0A5C3EBX9_9BASI|nr:related to calpain-like protease PalBory [Ustilago trichophora]
MSAPITRADWEAKLKHAQDQAHRATKAELARNYSEAFELYVRAGQLFVWLLGNFPSQTQNSHATLVPSAQASTSSSRAGSEPASLIAGDAFSGAAAAAQTRQRLKHMATKVMARAEKIKVTRKDLRPVDRDTLSQEEQSSILVTSSLINGHRYPIWNGPPCQQQITAPLTSTQGDQPALSPVQLRKGALYRRPSQVSSIETQGWSRQLKGSDLVQDIVTDCSFVAALEVAAEHDHLFGGRLVTSALYPQDSQGRIQPSSSGQYHVKLHINGTPRLVTIDDHLPYYPPTESSTNPTAPVPSNLQPDQHRLMCATSRNGQAVWPALLEKAYLKVMGGYDFVGSNGSIDLYALTGWLPEHIFLRHAGFQREKTWNRFHAAWRAGRCMATVGTGKAPSHHRDRSAGQANEELATITLESGLVSSHNYAILDVLERGSRRYVKLMNPWRTAAGIRPAIAISAKEEQRIYASSSAGPVSQTSLEDELGRMKVDASEEVDSASPTFTVTWDDLCSHFDSLFLNWDPSLFDNNVTVHSNWPGTSSTQSTGATSLGFKQPDPHFRLSVTIPPTMPSNAEAAADPSAEVWLLLTRHITSTLTSDQPRQSSNQASSEYIALHVFEDDQRASEGRQLASVSALPLRKAKHMGAYVDGTHCLVRLKPSFLRERATLQSGSEPGNKQQHQQCSFTIVVSRRDERDPPSSPRAATREDAGKDVNYTLSVFSRYRMELSELRTRLPYCESVTGSWTARTAGGNATLASFMSNPQYTLIVPAGPDEVQMQVVLESGDRRVPVQVLLTYPGAGSGRVTYLTEGDVVLSSGMYHHGLALCSTSQPGTTSTVLRPGTYTLIASTFEAGTQGDFHLRVEATRPVQLKPIPQEGAGMFHRRLASSWKRGSSAFGSPANSKYFNNPSWQFTIDRPGLSGLIARIRVEAMRSTDTVRPYINLALFTETEAGLREVASSGGYTDQTCGAAIEHVKLPSGTYRLVASTYQPDTEAEFAIDLYTATKVDVVPL